MRDHDKEFKGTEMKRDIKAKLILKAMNWGVGR